MSADLRAARSDDYAFALGLYVETIKPYTVAYMSWADEEQNARFARLWNPADTLIIIVSGVDIGWLEASETAPEIFLKQIYVAPAHQRRGIGSEVLRHLLYRWNATGKPVVLGVLKNNPARGLYERLGFTVTGETEMKFMMRREASASAVITSVAATGGAPTCRSRAPHRTGWPLH